MSSPLPPTDLPAPTRRRLVSFERRCSTADSPEASLSASRDLNRRLSLLAAAPPPAPATTGPDAFHAPAPLLRPAAIAGSAPAAPVCVVSLDDTPPASPARFPTSVTVPPAIHPVALRVPVQAYIPLDGVAKHLVSCGANLVSDDLKVGLVRVWDMSAVPAVAVPVVSEAPVAVPSPPGPAASPAADCSVSFAAHAGLVTGIVCPPPASVVVTSGDDGKIKVWNALSGGWECMKVIDAGCSNVSCLGIMGTLVVSGESHTVPSHLDSPIVVKSSSSAPAAESDELHRRAAPRVFGCRAALSVWDVSDSWPLVCRIEGAHARHVFAVAAVADRWLASIGDDWCVRVWDKQAGWSLYNQIDGKEGSFLSLLSLYPVLNRPVIVTGGSLGRVQFWDVSSEWPLVCAVSQAVPDHEVGLAGNVVSLSLMSVEDSLFVLTGEDSAEGRVFVWERAPLGRPGSGAGAISGTTGLSVTSASLNWRLADSFAAHSFGVSAVVPFVSKAGAPPHLATLGRDGSLLLWNAPV